MMSIPTIVQPHDQQDADFFAGVFVFRLNLHFQQISFPAILLSPHWGHLIFCGSGCTDIILSLKDIFKIIDKYNKYKCPIK